MRPWMRRSLFLAPVVLFAGCATQQAAVPRDQLVSANTTLENARQSGAAQVPPAERHLQLAQEQYQHATKLIEQGENRRAAFVLERAQADAELAWALSQELQVRAEAQRLLQQLQATSSANGSGN